MNLPNKITVSRIVLSFLILIMLVIPFSAFGIKWPEYSSIFGFKLASSLSLKYIIAGILFIIASITDKLDGYLARKLNQVTDLGKMLDSIADKMLVNGVLIIMAYDRIIPLFVPVIIITRDIIVDTAKMVSGSKGKVVAASWTGKIKTAFMMIGVSFMMFNNLPFELIHIPFAPICIYIATVLSVISGVEYYFGTLKLLKSK